MCSYVFILSFICLKSLKIYEKYILSISFARKPFNAEAVYIYKEWPIKYNYHMKKSNSLIAILVAFSLLITASIGESFAAKKNKNSDSKQTEAEQSVPAPEIETGSAVVFCASTSQLVYGVHHERKLSPGNLTKIMTAMIVIDNLHDSKEYKNKIELTQADKDSDAGLADFDSISIEDLLEHMINSGSDVAAELLAKYSASSTEVFVNEMNSKALSMGLVDTQFVNATGAYSEMQYTTPYDMAVICQYAMRYEKILQMLEDTESDVYYKYVVAQINGNMTEPNVEAQEICIARKDDLDLIVVLLGEDELTRQTNTENLLKYGFSKVSRNMLVKAGEKVGRVSVKHGAKTRVNCYTKTKGFAYVPPEGSESLIYKEMYFYDDLEAPLKKGTKVGECRIYVADELKGTVDLVIKEDVKTGWFPSYIYISNMATVIIVVVILLILLEIIRIINRRKARARRKEALRQKKIDEIARKQLKLEEDRRKRGWTNL